MPYATILVDGFESSPIIYWLITQEGDAAVTQDLTTQSPPGLKSVKLHVTTNSGSRANLQFPMTATNGVQADGYFNVSREGAGGSNVPTFRFFNGATRICDIYRENTTGKLWARVDTTGGGTYSFHDLGVTKSLNTWFQVTMKLDTGTLTVLIDGVQRYSGSGEAYTSIVDRVYIGAEHTLQDGDFNADNVTISANQPATTLSVTPDSSLGPAEVVSPDSLSAVADIRPSENTFPGTGVYPGWMPDSAASFGVPTAGWKFILATSPTSGYIGEFTKATNRQVAITLNKPGSLTMEVSFDDPLASQIAPIETCILAVRDGVIRWSGPVWTVDAHAETRKIQVSCVGWFEFLNHRLVRDISFDDQNFGGPAQTNLTGNWNALTGTIVSQDGLHITVNPSVSGIRLRQDISLPVGAPVEFYIFALTNTGSAGGTPTNLEIYDVTTGNQIANTTYVLGADTYNGLLCQFVVPPNTFATSVLTNTLAIELARTDPNGQVTMFQAWLAYGKLDFFNHDLGDIAQRLVQTAGSEWVVPGTTQTSWPRTVSYPLLANIGEEIQRMSDVENGYDWEVDPATKAFNVFWPMKGRAKTNLDVSIDAHRKLGAIHHWTCDDTGSVMLDSVQDHEPIDGAWFGDVFQGASLESYNPGSHSMILDAVDGAGAADVTADDPRSGQIAIGTDTNTTFNAFGCSAIALTGLVYFNQPRSTLDTFGVFSLNTATSRIIGFTALQSGSTVTLFSLIGTTVFSQLVLEMNTIYHLGLVLNPGDQTLNTYVNGVRMSTAQVGTSAPIPSIDSEPTLSYFAGYTNGASSFPYLGGYLDELAMFMRPLSPSEMFHLYQCLRGRSPATLGAEADEVRFGYGGSIVAQNLASVRRLYDTSWLTNYFYVLGKSGQTATAVIAVDHASIDRFGTFEATQTLSETDAPNILYGYANAEVALRRFPRVTYEVQPQPWTPTGNVPRLFDDYDVGDIVAFDCETGIVGDDGTWIRDGIISVRDQPIRIFGVSIQIDEQNQERVTLTTAPGA